MGVRKFIKVNRDLTGQKQNLLTALSKFDKNGRWFWTCSCECGGTTSIREDYFVAGKTKSCGCFGSRNSIHRINRKEPGESALNSIYSSYSRAASRRGYVFEINKQEFKQLIYQNCYYCTSEPVPSHFNKNAYGELKANGIDRIDNSVGYLLANCVPCCKACNIAKSVMGLKEFYSWIDRLYKNLAKDKLSLLTDCGLDFSTIFEDQL